jgi:hypothetical protein
MAGVTFKIEGVKGLEDVRRVLDPKMASKIQDKALKAAMRAAKNQLIKDISSRYAIKVRLLALDNEISDPVISALSGTIEASSVPRTLNQFVFNPGRRGSSQPGRGRGKGWGKPSRPGQPASFKVLKGAGLKQSKNAFKAQGLPFMRISNKKGKGTLRVMHGPSVARIFIGKGKFSREFKKNAAEVVETVFIKVTEQAVNNAIKDYGVKVIIEKNS